ncbi:hypothetical protein FPK15_contig00015-0005 [Flavobacterium psychrophilum]|nr:hypothetical protein FPK15_contig00015-0005 [Flavobacterium psychrophilum]
MEYRNTSVKIHSERRKNTVVNVEKAIAKVGHDTEAVKANINDYDNLHTCCKYER